VSRFNPLLCALSSIAVIWFAMFTYGRADIWEAPSFKKYSSAVEAYNRGDYPQARALLESSLSDYPDNVLSQYLLAQTLLRMGQEREALKAFEKTSKLYPNLPEIWEVMGTLQERLGFLSKAVATYHNLAWHEPKNPLWHERLSRIALKTGDKKGAEVSLKTWLKLEPRSEEPAVLLADLLSNSGRWDEAAAVLEGHYPTEGCISIASRLGAGYFNRKLYNKAAPWLLKLTQLQPLSPDHPYALGIISYRAGDIQKAEQFFSQSLTLNPDYFEAAYNLGVLRMEQKHYQEALVMFEQCLRIRPDAKEPHLQMAHIYEAAIPDPAKAKEHHRKAGGRKLDK
jgi:tetratricopeptide (TPR) repeat protein